MSDAAVVEPPNPTPTESLQAGELKGVDKLMAELDKAVAPKPPEQKTPPEAKPGVAKTDPNKPAEPPKKPDEAGDADHWTKAPPRLRKAYEELKTSSTAKISEFEAKIRALESKPVEKPADTKLIEEYQGKISTLQKRLAESDYSRSDEFKSKYVDPLGEAYKAAIAEVKQLTVREGEGENAKDRQATEHDFRHIMNLPLKDQGIAARRMFGDAADAVLAHRTELARLQRDMESAVKKASEEHETRSKEQQLASEKQKETYDRTKESALQHLKTKWPHWFSDDTADAEATAALKSGYDFVKGFVDKAEKMSLEDHAMHAAIVEARAAGFQREVFKNTRLSNKVKSLEEELEKYRKSDPGAGGDPAGGGDPAASKSTGGIAAMAARFNSNVVR